MADLANSIPLVLKYQNWPEEDRKRWVTLTASGTIFDDGPFAKWTEGTRQFRQQGYGQWLSYLARTHPAELQLDPADRVRLETARGFVEECDIRLSPRSTHGLITSLVVIAMALDPGRDWTWLQRVQAKLRRRIDDTALAAPHPITAEDIFGWSLKRLRQVEQDESLRDLKRAVQFRQALMIGLLIARPVRRRAFLAMECNRHLKSIKDGFELIFSTEDMKDAQLRAYPLPTALVDPMRSYLNRHRPILLGRNNSQGLWLSQYGRPLAPDGFSGELPKVTERYLGVRLRTHAFRHIAATSIAERDPEHVGIIRDILGHATLRMSEKHYNRAKQLESARTFQSVMADLKSQIAPPR